MERTFSKNSIFQIQHEAATMPSAHSGVSLGWPTITQSDSKFNSFLILVAIAILVLGSYCVRRRCRNLENGAGVFDKRVSWVSCKKNNCSAYDGRIIVVDLKFCSCKNLKQKIFFPMGLTTKTWFLAEIQQTSGTLLVLNKKKFRNFAEGLKNWRI